MASGRCVRVLGGHAAGVCSVTMGADDGDGQTVISSSQDTSIRCVWVGWPVLQHALLP